MHRFISRFVAKKAPTQVTPARSAKKLPRTRLGIEILERRDVPSTSLNNGVLSVNGTTGDDVIEMRTREQNSIVFTQVLVNGVSEFDAAASISRIDIDGRAGLDEVFIRRLQPGVSGHANVVNSERVTVGEPNADGLFSLDNVRSRITAIMPSDGRLSIRGDADTASKTVNVNAGFVSGLSPFNIFYEFASGAKSRLSMTTGSGNDTVNVNSTPTLGAIGLTISTHGGDDTFNVAATSAILRLNGYEQNDTFNLTPSSQSMNLLDRSVFVNGGLGTNSLVMDDRARGLAGQTYDATFGVDQFGGTFEVDQFNIQSSEHDIVSVKYHGVQSVRYAAPDGIGEHEVHVKATEAGVETIIDTFRTTEVNIGDAESLSLVDGPVIVNRVSFGGRIVLDDSAQSLGHTYDLQANTATRTGVGLVSFDANTSEVRVLAGNGSDHFGGNLRASLGIYRLDGGGGNDTLGAPNTANFWDVTNDNAGTLNERVAFNSVETLLGGSGDDYFRLANGRGVSGLIRGDLVLGGETDVGGFDIIDYSAYTTHVDVDLGGRLGRNVGEGVAGRLTGIDVIFGGSAGDLLIGNSLANVLLGGHGNDTVRGGSGRDILFGGDGADDLDNRDGNDGTLYVTGITDSSVNKPSALKALRAEWTRTDNTTAQKRSNITEGGGLNGAIRLNTTTVFNDFDIDIVRAGTGIDLIFLHSSDLLDGNQSSFEIF